MLATGGTFNMKLPNEKMNLFVANKYPILNECVEKLLGETNVDSKFFITKTQKERNQ